MMHKTKIIRRALAQLFHLKLVFVDYLPDHVYGKLLVRERRILINAHKPRHEHTFTVLHELGHYTQHVVRPRRKFHPKIFDVHWQLQWLTNICGRVRRAFRFVMNKSSGKEWQADAWAMCAFFYLSIHIGSNEELLTFIDHHPEKWKTVLLAAYSVSYCGIKTRIKNLAKSFMPPYAFPYKAWFLLVAT